MLNALLEFVSSNPEVSVDNETTPCARNQNDIVNIHSRSSSINPPDVQYGDGAGNN